MDSICSSHYYNWHFCCSSFGATHTPVIHSRWMSAFSCRGHIWLISSLTVNHRSRLSKAHKRQPLHYWKCWPKFMHFLAQMQGISRVLSIYTTIKYFTWISPWHPAGYWIVGGSSRSSVSNGVHGSEFWHVGSHHKKGKRRAIFYNPCV